MSRSSIPKIEELTDLFALWNTYRNSRLAKGFDVASEFAKWATEVAEGLTSPGAREEFGELCEAGCFPQGLALTVLALRRAPQLEIWWSKTMGDPAGRAKAIRSLEDAAQTLESLYSGVIPLGKDGENELSRIGRIPIPRLTSELRFHIRLINLAQMFRGDHETHSPEEVAKFLLSGYVRHMTGDFHDRCVSGLVGEVIHSDRYTEDAHRMWRKRNYGRLEKHYLWMVKLLVAASVVVAHEA
jgi:hypothetical protein